MMDPTDFSFFENAAAQQQQAKQRINLNFRFYSETYEIVAESLKAGRPIYGLQDYCEINVPGSRDTTVKKVNQEFFQKYGDQQYKMWKATQEQPVEGTPITTVPFLNIAQVKEFQALNVVTLEQLAGLSDMAVQKIGMGAMEARRKAQAFMKAGSDTAAQTRLISENENLKRDVTRLTEQVANLTQRIENLMSGGPLPALHPSVIVNGKPPAPAPSPPPAEPVFDVAAFVKEEIRKALQNGN